MPQFSFQYSPEELAATTSLLFSIIVLMTSISFVIPAMLLCEREFSQSFFLLVPSLPLRSN